MHCNFVNIVNINTVTYLLLQSTKFFKQSSMQNVCWQGNIFGILYSSRHIEHSNNCLEIETLCTPAMLKMNGMNIDV